MPEITTREAVHTIGDGCRWLFAVAVPCMQAAGADGLSGLALCGRLDRPEACADLSALLMRISGIELLAASGEDTRVSLAYAWSRSLAEASALHRTLDAAVRTAGRGSVPLGDRLPLVLWEFERIRGGPDGLLLLSGIMDRMSLIPRKEKVEWTASRRTSR